MALFFIFHLFILVGIFEFLHAAEKDGYVVTQVHLSQGRSPAEMTVSWVTASSAPSDCAYGISEVDMTNKVSGSSTSYSVGSSGVLNQVTPYTSGALHSANLVNLKPSSTYFYKCGDLNSGITSGIISFETLPDVGDKSKQIVFGVIGDLGMTNDSKVTLAHMEMNPDISMILHVGDLSYANCNHASWDSYGVMVEPLAKQVPWMAVAGNHEIEMTSVSGSSVFTAFEKRFNMPRVQPASFGAITYWPSSVAICTPSEFQSMYDYGNSFFSFDSGMAHVVNLNPYSLSNSTSEQYKWLVNDLSSVDRSVTPWVVVQMHCPFYNSNKDHHDEFQALMMKQFFEPLLYQYKANVVFNGHVHAYERSHPVFQNTTRDDGVTYIQIGDGGNAEGHATNYYEMPAWSAYRNGTQYGHGVLTLINETHSEWTWNRNVDGVKVAQDTVYICNTGVGLKANCQV